MRTLCAVCALLACAVPVSARAESPEATEQARQEFETGVGLLDAHQYAEAAAALERSVALRASPRALYNLALAYRGLRQYQHALALLQRILAVDSGATPEVREAASVSAGEIEAAFVHVVLQVSGEATDVLLDGQVIASGDGRQVLTLDPGHHAFEARRAGYEPARRERDFDPGARDEIALDAAAHAIPARVTVETNVAGAVIQIDGRTLRGTNESELTAGVHRIEARASGGRFALRTLRVELGSRTTVSLSLRAPILIERWWFWSGSGAIATGLVAGIVWALQPQPPPRGTWANVQGLVER